MKRLLLGLFIALLFQLPGLAKVESDLFIVKNAKANIYIRELASKFKDVNIKEDCIYRDGKAFYYLKAYQSGNDLNVIVMADKKDKTDYSAILKSTNYKTYSLEDKDLTKKYMLDCKTFLNMNNISVNGVKIENNKYNPYDKPIKNRIIRTTTYSSKNVDFKVNKLKLKSAKLKNYAYGYEIIIKNNTGKNIVLKSVNSADFIGLAEIAKQVVKLNGVDFIPVYGIIAGVKTDVEKNRFTRPFPKNYILRSNEDVRILGISEILVEPIVDFIFIIDGKEITIQLHTYL